MFNTLYLVRHGEKQKIKGDPPLTALGQEQAKLTALYLSGKGVDFILSSPILRAQQTAEAISKKLNLPFETEPLLRERSNWGDDDGQTFEDFLEMWNKSTVDRDWVPPVGDSSRNAGERISRVINSPKYSDLNLVLVTHGGVIRDFLRNVFQEQLLDSVIPSFSSSLEDMIDEASVTTILMNQDKKVYELVALNFTDHLSGL